jgi:hypothetical protein
MIVSVLVDNTSTYPCSTDVEQFPSEITPRGAVAAHPYSHEAPVFHYRQKVNFYALARSSFLQRYCSRLSTDKLRPESSEHSKSVAFWIVDGSFHAVSDRNTVWNWEESTQQSFVGFFLKDHVLFRSRVETAQKQKKRTLRFYCRCRPSSPFESAIGTKSSFLYDQLIVRDKREQNWNTCWPVSVSERHRMIKIIKDWIDNRLEIRKPDRLQYRAKKHADIHDPFMV